MCKYHRLKDLRTDKEKTQEEIAKIIETTAQYYSSYEQGKRDIPFARIIKLAKYYNVSTDYIAGLTNDPEPKWNTKNNITITGGKNKLKFE